MQRVFVPENADELHGAIRAFPLVFLLVGLPSDGVHQGVGCDRVHVIAGGTLPGDRDPLAFPVYGLVLVQSHRFGAALRAFLFYGSHHHMMLISLLHYVLTIDISIKMFAPNPIKSGKASPSP